MPRQTGNYVKSAEQLGSSQEVIETLAENNRKTESTLRAMARGIQSWFDSYALNIQSTDISQSLGQERK